MEPKKLIILRILQLLEKESDQQHPLTQLNLINLLKIKYGIECERKAIGRNISFLKEAGYVIESTRAGVYLDSRRFEKSELILLIDSVLASRYIDNKHSEDLINKLINEGGKYFTSGMKNLYFNKHWSKTENKSVFYNVEILDEAIEKKLKVKFIYNYYDIHKKLVPRKNYYYIVNPFQLLLHNQRYYLICNLDKYEDIRYLRIDRITNIEILDEFSKPINTINGYKNGLQLNNIDTTLPYMFGEKAEIVTLKCKKEMINDIIDWFGTSFSVKELDNTYIEITLSVSIEAMKYWLMQYGTSIEVVSPLILRDTIANTVRKMNEIYN
jgi:predicted DNA-binding transcriptional regulator YafY